MDITHDNVCSSMLSCFYSHLLSTGRPISSFNLNSIISTGTSKMMYFCKHIKDNGIAGSIGVVR